MENFVGTLIYYNPNENVTVFKSTIKKDIAKFKSKYPASSIQTETDTYIEGYIEGKHIMIPKYKTEEYKQSLINKMNKGE